MVHISYLVKIGGVVEVLNGILIYAVSIAGKYVIFNDITHEKVFEKFLVWSKIDYEQLLALLAEHNL